MKTKIKTFEVPVCYRGQTNYIVVASSKDEAEKIARARFENGENGDVPIIEFEKIDRIGEIEEIKD
jgi:hypothetical protein